MAPTKAGDTSSWASKRFVQPNVRFTVATAPLKLDKGLLAKRSAKIAAILEENPYEDLTTYFQTLKVEPETLELIARFCHGLEVHMTTNNIIPLICLTHNLKMTETHSPNNLLDTALRFLEQRILPSWDESIRSLRASSTQTLEQCIDIGLFQDFSSTLTAHALANPSLLAKLNVVEANCKAANNGTRRKLFGGVDHSTCVNGSSEDLTSLPLLVYEPVISVMARQQVPQDYIMASLFQYLKSHQSDKEVIEAVERLLPSESYITTALLVELYSLSVSLGADPECLTGLEIRIGKQLDQITLKDLLALDLGVDNLKQILKGFYGNYNGSTNSGLVVVSELMELYLIEIAKEIDLDSSIFTEVAELVIPATLASNRCNDAIYRAVDVYLDNHRELSDEEKEEICRVIDFEKMSKQACGHATQNQRLPLRVVVRALFVSHLQLRDDIIKAVGPSCNNSNVEEEEDGGEIKVVEDDGWGDERREIIDGEHKRSCCGKSGKKKGSLWKEVKRKFGCISSNSYESVCDCNCQVKKRKKS
ncbi:BTB/POZ domain-containing protein At3g03510-like [Silene latifolia]|uniref:BTB/POZ domain-containing protein At3g03510-like n=1 Tax=Silene latifolia TaxID=37657 RepID=UPI003D77DA42